jgi:hypothetical protein
MQGGRELNQGRGITVSLGAIAASLASIACCLPLGFVAALGMAGASAFVDALRPWLLALAVAFLGAGFWQQRRARQCAVRPSVLNVVLLWSAVVVVAGMVLFPQEIAGFIADRLLTGGKP